MNIYCRAKYALHRLRVTQGIIVGFFCTFFQALNLPVFWPMLVFYFLFMFIMTMRQQINHMIKYRYLPFSFGKKTYSGKGSTN